MYSYDYYYSSSSSNPTAAIIALVVAVITIVALWKVDKKAGYEGWETLIPIYNLVIMFKIAGLSPWNILLLFVPFVNIYIVFRLYINLAHKFGKSTAFGVGIVFLSIVFLPLMAFDDNCVYQTGIEQPMNNNQQMYNNQQQMYNNQPMNNNQQIYNNQPANNNQQMYNNQQPINNQQPVNNNQNYFCPNCGTQLNNNVQFCPNCGRQKQ